MFKARPLAQFRTVAAPILLCCLNAWAQPTNLAGALKQQVGEFEIHEKTFVQALFSLAGQCKIPLAIEWIQRANAEKLTRSWRAAQTSSILDDLLSSESDYIWSLSGNVLHVYHRRLYADQRNFLNLKIDSYAREGRFQDVQNGLSYKIRELVRPREGRPLMGNPGSGPSGTGDLVLDFSVRDVTLREALDKLILQNPLFKIWFVTYPGDGSLTAKGFFEVAQALPVDRAEQPFWNFLRWGDDPYWLSAPAR